ncbi:MAG: hypothetical protein DHS20C19_30510 [Acidimicrobiales bacterium]|nr:MAG: hypothetical protein DHS20C19_30510 [Acidimicrobiales bacterium]
MDLRTIVLILLRRWYVAAPIAALALYVAAGSGGSPSYTVEGSFLLVVAQDTSTEDGPTNPIITTPSGINSVANVAVVVMHTSERRTDVAEAGYSPSYNFSVANNDPFVNFEVADDDELIAVESAAVLARLFTEEMTVQQQRFGVDAGALARAELLEISESIADYSSVRTGQITVAAAGFLLAFMAAFAVEGVFYFFSDRRREFHEFDKYESDASKYGVGGETAAEFRPSSPVAALANPPEQAELEQKTSSRWVRARGRRAEG